MRFRLLSMCLLLLCGFAAGADCTGDAAPPIQQPPVGTDPQPDPDPQEPDPDPDPDVPLTCEPSCALGRVCHEGNCVPAGVAQAQIGYTDDATDVFTHTPDGATMPYSTFGQGGSHIFVTLRVAGLAVPADGSLKVSYTIWRPEDNLMLAEYEQVRQFESIGGGIFEEVSWFIFLSEFPELLQGDTIRCIFTITSTTDVAQTVTVEQSLVMEFVP